MTLHPQSVAFLSDLGAPTPAEETDVAAVRAQAREAALAETGRIGLDAVIDLDAGGVPVRLYRPALGAPVALYVHGGGWVLHDLETHDAFCRHVAHRTGWALLAVDYRRAPEHPYPAPLDDVETAARWLRAHAREHRVDASFLPGIGDSSGANLVAGLVVRDPALLDMQVLVYPATDRHAPLDPALDTAALTAEQMEWFWRQYAGDATAAEVSPLRADDVSATPPTVVVTSEHDVLRDQGEAYAARLAEAGVPVTAWRALGVPHSFWRMPERFDASRATVLSVGALMDARRTAHL
jgi:acetyl esterase